MAVFVRYPALLLASCLLLNSSQLAAMEMLLDELVADSEVPVAGQRAGKCHRVVDGDSLYIAGSDTQIRLWGVDAPERDEHGYQRAKDSLRKLALGKYLRCVQQDIDKYGRVVARCYRKNDNRELNRVQIESGVADEYCHFTRGYYGHCR